MMVIPSGSTILAPALSAAMTAWVCSSREKPLVSSPATTQIFLTPSFLATGTAVRISSSNSSRRAGSGLVIP